MRDKPQNEIEKNCLWMYSLSTRSWSVLYKNDNHALWASMGAPPSSMAGITEGSIEPCPRFAHQVVLHSKTKLQYLFGGNPGDNANAKDKKRLDDLWELTIRQMSADDVSRDVVKRLRMQEYREMVATGFESSGTTKKQVSDRDAIVENDNEEEIRALLFLQQQVLPCVDESNPADVEEFSTLTALLFQPLSSSSPSPSSSSSTTQQQQWYEQRLSLFNQICEFLPKRMRPPQQSLLDLPLLQ